MRRVVPVVVVAATTLFVTSALAAGGATTKVTLDFIQPTPSGTIYTGDIFSPKKACKNKRRVTVLRVRDGKDDKRGSTLSYKGSDQPGYFWALEEDGIPPAGKYYAKVRKTERCEKDRSPKYTFTP